MNNPPYVDGLVPHDTVKLTHLETIAADMVAAFNNRILEGKKAGSILGGDPLTPPERELYDLSVTLLTASLRRHDAAEKEKRA
jgi:hypothetical protein